LPIVHTHSRPILSDRWPSAIWPGTAARSTAASAQAAVTGENPISVKASAAIGVADRRFQKLKTSGKSASRPSGCAPPLARVLSGAVKMSE
jgi:hypothetical protein